jgi:hypothetical protein
MRSASRVRHAELVSASPTKTDDTEEVGNAEMHK